MAGGESGGLLGSASSLCCLDLGGRREGRRRGVVLVCWGGYISRRGRAGEFQETMPASLVRRQESRTVAVDGSSHGGAPCVW